MCALKEVGGLGLRNLKTMNNACLMKLIWRIMINKDDFWSKVLENKYKWNVD